MNCEAEKIFVAEAGEIEEIRRSNNGQTPIQKRGEQTAFAVEVLETRLGLVETLRIIEELAPHNESASGLSVAIVRKERMEAAAVCLIPTTKQNRKLHLPKQANIRVQLLRIAKRASSRKQILEERQTVIAENPYILERLEANQKCVKGV